MNHQPPTPRLGQRADFRPPPPACARVRTFRERSAWPAPSVIARDAGVGADPVAPDIGELRPVTERFAS
jgi:hypothetical protein